MTATTAALDAAKAQVNGTKAATAAPTPAAPTLVINRIGTETLLIPVVGTSPLITHKWSEKARRKMLDAQQGKKNIKENRNPEEDYQSSIYRMNDGTPGFPALAFKAATVEASRLYDKSVTKVLLRQALFFKGEQSENDSQPLFRITGDYRMREDVVTVGISGTDLRYRAEFPEWSTVLCVTYVKSLMSQESVVSLIDAAGLTVGVGEWRPEKGGEFGTFQIAPDKQITVVNGLED